MRQTPPSGADTPLVSGRAGTSKAVYREGGSGQADFSAGRDGAGSPPGTAYPIPDLDNVMSESQRVVVETTRPAERHRDGLGGGLVDYKAALISGASASNTKPALNGGVGVAYNVGGNGGFFLQGRYVNVFTSGSDLSLVPLTAGFQVSF